MVNFKNKRKTKSNLCSFFFRKWFKRQTNPRKHKTLMMLRPENVTKSSRIWTSRVYCHTVCTKRPADTLKRVILKLYVTVCKIPETVGVKLCCVFCDKLHQKPDGEILNFFCFLSDLTATFGMKRFLILSVIMFSKHVKHGGGSLTILLSLVSLLLTKEARVKNKFCNKISKQLTEQNLRTTFIFQE